MRHVQGVVVRGEAERRTAARRVVVAVLGDSPGVADSAAEVPTEGGRLATTSRARVKTADRMVERTD